MSNVHVPESGSLVMILTRDNPKYLDRFAFANSVDPDLTPQNAISNNETRGLPVSENSIGSMS